ncbi:HEPN domain-containing protein [Candidatus Dojkabacteria bacterium]|nr:HEPN domain-containing protein [Candidatus Dojkabacteria bacterium]
MRYPLKRVGKKIALSRFQIWFNQSRFDMDAARLSFNNQYYEWACYQSTQAVEKALKSMLMNNGWWPPRTHKLSVLIGLCNNINKSFKKTKFVFRDLEVYTYAARYPFILPDKVISPHEFIKKGDAQKCLDQAQNLLKIIRELLDVEVVVDTGKYDYAEAIDPKKRIETVTDILIQEMDPEKIVLFGGYARGKKKLSTLDILIIVDTKLDFMERLHKVREITKGGLPAVEPVVYTQKEYKLLIEEGDTFLHNIMKTGKVLYEKNR